FLNEATIYQNGKDRFIGETGLSDDTHLGSAIGIPPEPELRSDNNLLPAVQVNNYNCKDVSGNCIDKSSPKFGGQEGQSLDKSTPKFSGQKGGAITNTPTIYENVGETGFIGQTGGVALEHGPGISGDLRNSNTGTIDPISKEEKPRTSVQLKFIEGAWREVGEPTPLNPATP
ncbi:MAG: hypothetical protein NZ824_01375, partial [Candidatus Thioglobus sp.]|nr:hypothetical protein [Candidatus Thioglobus sp.]